VCSMPRTIVDRRLLVRDKVPEEAWRKLMLVCVRPQQGMVKINPGIDDGDFHYLIRTRRVSSKLTDEAFSFRHPFVEPHVGVPGSVALVR
jgi:hypothetical protein